MRDYHDHDKGDPYDPGCQACNPPAGEGCLSSDLFCDSTMSNTPKTDQVLLDDEIESLEVRISIMTDLCRQLEVSAAKIPVLKKAFANFDDAREANQWPNTGQAWDKDATELIDKLRNILQNAKADS